MQFFKRLFLCALLGLAASAASAGEAMVLDKAPDRSNDQAALQHGAKLFVNYCLGCHSAAFMRFNRLTDIGISEKQIKEYLLFTTDKVGDTMQANINPKEAKAWFGATPPDLTLIARSRTTEAGSGADYLYTYLRSYYPDPTKETGWNNLVFPNVAMPHPLWQLQGIREPIYETVVEHGEKVQVFKGWKQVTPGTMSEKEFDSAVADLVAYLQWMGEPAQKSRIRMGVWVLLYLLVFVVIAWRLNAAFWKDVK